MRPRLLTDLSLQLAQTLAFAGIAAWMFEESRGLSGRWEALQLASAVASCLLAALALRTLVLLVLDRPLLVLPTRALASGCVQAMIGAAVLGVAAARIHSSGRPALAAFSTALAVWILALGFDLLPRAWLSRRNLVEHWGRRVALSSLEWFELRRAQADPPRLSFIAGDSHAVRVRYRLAANRETEGLAAHLKDAGLRDRPPD